MSVRELTLKDGTKRYRFTADVAPRSTTGKRPQKTQTFATRDEAEAELARIRAFRERHNPPRSKSAVRAVEDAGFAVVRDVLGAGRCSGMCLCAFDDCECRCGGEFHGALLDSLIPLRHPDGPERRPAALDADMTDLIILARREGIRAVRRRCGLLAEAVGDRAGIGAATVYSIEAGKQQPTLAQVLALAEVYGLQQMTVDDLAAIFGKVAPRRKVAS